MPIVNQTVKLRGRRQTQRFAAPDKQPVSNRDTLTDNPALKPARITRQQLGAVLHIVQRAAKGGDATLAVDATGVLPLLQSTLAAAPHGNTKPRVDYDVQLADGTTFRAAGLRAAALAAGKAESTIANALHRGKGRATFPCPDEHGNPALVTVTRVA